MNVPSTQYADLSFWGRFSSMRGVVAILLILAAIGFAVGARNDFTRTYRVREHGLEATAVVSYFSRAGRYQPDEPVISYRTREGAWVIARVSWSRWAGPPVSGSVRQIRYDPADPKGNVIDCRASVDA
ncbi:hypothetical protein GCM10023194_28910 [Planotetraspora phitsanulokensis]|uniref:DUF3592 domain-containing protein n=1 Tax=Planotetraspora phitsanulokensis TaxID=575192 RepID=A0A8J3U292_9ACTN|nr:DUF3592 domain-containing protein [Planotetraspora phitsanulokensis]GII35971.1 hypothetical protein Pph01_09740 [Planotetraspora phitsanulokensis]